MLWMAKKGQSENGKCKQDKAPKVCFPWTSCCNNTQHFSVMKELYNDDKCNNNDFLDVI